MNLNIFYWFLLVAISFSLITLAYKLFGKSGLYAWVVLAGIVANIQVMKTIELFGIVTSVGNVIYASSFLVTDILSENHSRQEAGKAIKIGFFTLISTIIIMQISLNFIPHQSDFSQKALETIFGFFPRVVFASLVSYLISQTHDIWAYEYWKKKFSKKSQIYIRNNLSTIVSQIIDTTIFCFLAFWGVHSLNIFFNMYVSLLLFKIIIAVLDTPFVYLSTIIRKKGWKNYGREEKRLLHT